MIRETVSEILGERVDSDIAINVKNLIVSFPEVSGAYDLVIHNYGPDRLIGSVHISVPDYMTARELDKLERSIAEKVMVETGVIMTGVSIYSVNTHCGLQFEIDYRMNCFYRTVMQRDGRSCSSCFVQIRTDTDNKNSGQNDDDGNYQYHLNESKTLSCLSNSSHKTPPRIFKCSL